MAATPALPSQTMWVDWLLRLNLAASLYMTGVIWFVQLVHYPLFSAVPASSFKQYEQRHQQLTTFVVAPPMLLELGASIALVYLFPTSTVLWITAALTLVNWASTMGIQVPLHNKLGSGLDLTIVQDLVQTNWIRTIAWTLRSAILLYNLR